MRSLSPILTWAQKNHEYVQSVPSLKIQKREPRKWVNKSIGMF